jgi:FMN reductase
MKTLIISSSLSLESRSYELCKKVSEKLVLNGVDVELIDARELKLEPYHRGPTSDMQELAEKIKFADNVIFGMGVHCYSVNDGLKMILDSLSGISEGMLFGILCAGGGRNSYLSTMHLTQICMNEWRMMQLPRIVYVTKDDFENDQISGEDVLKRIDKFVEEFVKIGEKLAD